LSSVFEQTKNSSKNVLASLFSASTVYNQIPKTVGEKLGDLTSNVGSIFKEGLLGGLESIKGTIQLAKAPFSKLGQVIGLTAPENTSKDITAKPRKSVTDIAESTINGVKTTVSSMGKLATLPFASLKSTFNGMGNFMVKTKMISPSQAKAIGGAMSSIGGAIGGGAAMMAVQALMGFMDALNPFKPVIEALTDIFSVYGEILGTAFMPLIEKLYEVMLSPDVIVMMSQLAMAFSGIVSAFLPLIDIISPFAAILMAAFIIPLQLVTPLIQLLGITLAPLGGYMSTVSGAINSFSILIGTSVQPIIEKILPFIQDFATDLGKIFGLGWAAVTLLFTGLSDAWGTVTSAFTGSGGIWDGIKTGWAALKTAVIGIPDFFKGIANGLIGIINAPINAINKLLPKEAQLGTIPLLAQGGITQGPMLAMIGDNPSGREAVIPLDSHNNPLNGMGGGVTIIVNGDITDEKIETLKREMWIGGFL